MDELRLLPEIEKLKIKEDFEKRYRVLLKDQYENFMKYSLSYIRKCIRVNTLKTSVNTLTERLRKQGIELQQIPWSEEGFWTRGRTDLGNLDEHFLGYFYVQEAASMLPAKVLLPNPGELVLDMCASPGSKTTQMAALMHNTGVIVANDITGARMKPLGLNLQRMGIMNTVVTVMRGQQFAKRGIKFDKILVDAPCSGTGTIRRNPETLRIWNPSMITRLSAVQKSLIKAGYETLKPGGTLVYSTCSVEPEENEGVVSYLLDETDAMQQKINLPIKKSVCFEEFNGKKYRKLLALRIWPQDNNTEGFFVAKITKPCP